ncbi:MAG: DUF4430 domain-containing protein [Firmicutes bacterium]|nr:DUF4430 domain-containing protein [Bacillota bacterium]MDY5857376.1 DUF4430 domain-containing protein [Anaerovoracaceae bacterium]
MDEKELEKQLKRKKLRKYIILALAAAMAVYGIVHLTVEGKDAKLADGQGNLPAAESLTADGDADNSRSETDENGKNEDGSDAEDETASGQKDEKTETPSSGSGSSGSESAKKDPAGSKDAGGKTPQQLKVDNSEDPTASNSGNSAYRPKEPENVTVTISISCATLASDMSKLENPAIRDYIPEDGWILKTVSYAGTTENTVFDVLNTVCRNNDIQLEFSYTPLYESNYIEGINYLYEFDGGNQSGWMYKVNGWFPNYGCSSYYLSDGDVIEWVYTCDLGKDVGDNSMAD